MPFYSSKIQLVKYNPDLPTRPFPRLPVWEIYPKPSPFLLLPLPSLSLLSPT